MGKHATDEGIVVGTRDGRRALLADFDFDSDQLRPKHRAWLDGLAGIIRRSHLRPPDGMWVITVNGRASQAGKPGYNAKLSERRLNAVRAYLDLRTGGVPIMWRPAALGEGSPHDPTVDDAAADRSVEVDAHPNVTLDPRPSPREPRIDVPKTLDLMVDSYLCTVGMGLHLRFTTWIINFTIIDPATDLGTPYVFEGGGSSAPVLSPFGGVIRSLAAGSRQPLVTHRTLGTDSFVGDAGFGIPGGIFRLGGNKLTDRGKRAFPRGKVEDFALPKGDSNLPAAASASGKIKRGFEPF